MRTTLRVALGALLVAATFAIPAGASGLCTVLRDREGDVRGLTDAFGLIPTATGETGAVDVRSLAMGVAGRELLIRIGLVNVDAAASLASGTPTVGAFWDSGGDRWFVQARRAGRAWTFTAGAASSGALPQSGGTAVDGSVDSFADALAFRVPLVLVGHPSRGSVLDEVRVRGSDFLSGGIANMRDSAPDESQRGGYFPLGSDCSLGLDRRTPVCLVGEDSATDAYREGVPGDEAVEVTGLSLGMSGITFAIEVRVLNLSSPVPEGTAAQRWRLTWRDAEDEYYFATAERRASGDVEFGYGEGAYATEGITTLGFLDESTNRVRILVPGARLGVQEGSVLSDISVIAIHEQRWEHTELESEAIMDVAPSPPARYVAGSVCPT